MSQASIIFTHSTSGAVYFCPDFAGEDLTQRNLTFGSTGTNNYNPSLLVSGTSYFHNLTVASLTYTTSSRQAANNSEFSAGQILRKYTNWVSVGGGYYAPQSPSATDYYTVSAGTVYTRSATSNNTGMGTVSATGGLTGTVSGYSLASWTATATANAGYHLDYWTLNGAYASSQASFTVDATDARDVALVAVFVADPPPCQLTATKTVGPTLGYIELRSGGSGSLLATDNGTVINYALTYGQSYYISGICYNDTTTLFLGLFDSTGTTPVSASFTATGNITVTAKFAARANYTCTLIASDGSAPTTNGSLSVSPAANYDATHWLANTELRVSATSANGYHLSGWNPAPATGSLTQNPLVFTLTANTTITAYFEPNKYVFTAEVDADSLIAATGTNDGYTIEYKDQYGDYVAMPEAGVPAGTFVRYTAHPDSPYGFGGWYDSTGTLIPATEVLDLQATADMNLTVKFTASVGIAASNSTAGLGKAEFTDASGTTVTHAAPYTEYVILGESVYLKATNLLTGADFKGWFLSSDTGFTAPIIGMGFTATITPTANVAYVARFTDSASTLYLWVTNGDAGQGLGELSSSAGTAIDKYDYDGFFLGHSPTSIEIGTDKYYTFDAAQDSIIGVVPLTTTPFLKWQIATINPTGTTPAWEVTAFADLPDDIKSNLSVSLLINKHYILKAIYRSSTPVLLRAMYTGDSDITKGTLLLTPAGNPSETADDHVQGHFTQGTTVTLSAIPANGYVFVGWYSDPDGATGHLLSALASYPVEITAEQTVYAKFDEDADAIYKWEGGTQPKLMTWQSKRFVSNKPFAPSAARVYADTYPVTLDIFMSSSPDSQASGTPSASLVIRSQNAVRVPMFRAEKYVEVQIRSPYAVSEMAISTSMGGLAQ